MAQTMSILAPSTTEYYSDKLTKYNYIFLIDGNTYSFNTLSTNEYDAYASLTEFFETFLDFAREWIDLNNKLQNILNKFHQMSRYSEAEKYNILSSNHELKKLDNEIYENFDILSNLLNMYSTIDYHIYSTSNMLHVINIIQYIKNTDINNFIQIH